MKYIVFGVFLMAGFSLFAQNSKKAKEILDEVSQKTQSYSTIIADFTFLMENVEEGISEGYSGTIKLMGEKYNVVIGDLAMTMISDGDIIWTYMEDANEVTISEVDKENTELLDPSTIFRIYEKGFNYNFIGEKTVDGISLYLIDLIPENDDQEYTKISIAVNKANMMIHSAIMFDTTNSQYKISILKLKTNREIKESQFLFDVSQYDDIEIIDFR